MMTMKKREKSRENSSESKKSNRRKECDCILAFLRNSVIDFIWTALVWIGLAVCWFCFFFVSSSILKSLMMSEKKNSFSMY